MGSVTISELEQRRKEAKREYDQFRPLRDDAYEFAIPYRKGISETGAGENRVNRIYDHTAMLSAFRSSSRLAQDVSPPGQTIFKFTAGDLAKVVLPRDELDALTKEIEPISQVVGAHFGTGEWDMALAEMGMDLQIGTGCMLIVPDRRRETSRFVSVPLEEVMLTSGPYNEVDGIFWCRKWSVRAIAAEFGADKLTKGLRDKLQDKPEDMLELYQDCVFEADTGRWCRVAWCKENVGEDNRPREFERSYSRMCPWITPRYFRVPGETYGRGPILMVMPTVKALNTATKLNLQGAAIAMLGIYTAMDDGVFNAENAPITPGAFWKVARNGGVMGASVQRFPDPRIDLSQIVLNELRMGVQAGMNDQSLPPDTAAVRSATEIMERVKRLASDHMGAFGRLIMEIMVPAVRRVMEIAFEFGQINTQLPLDRLLTTLQVSSPMALSREAERMQRWLQYFEMASLVAQAEGKPVGRYVKGDELMPEIAEVLAIPTRFVPTAEERAQMDEEAALQAAVMAGAAVAGGDPQALEEIGAAAA